LVIIEIRRRQGTLYRKENLHKAAPFVIKTLMPKGQTRKQEKKITEN